MAKIKLCEITDGRVTNIALADSDKVPAFMRDWIVDDGSATKGGTWDGTTFGPVPQADIDAAQDAEIERIVDETLQVRGGIKAVALTVFEIYDRLAAAGVAGFPALTNAQKRKFIKDRVN